MKINDLIKILEEEKAKGKTKVSFFVDGGGMFGGIKYLTRDTSETDGCYLIFRPVSGAEDIIKKVCDFWKKID